MPVYLAPGAAPKEWTKERKQAAAKSLVDALAEHNAQAAPTAPKVEWDSQTNMFIRMKPQGGGWTRVNHFTPQQAAEMLSVIAPTAQPLSDTISDCVKVLEAAKAKSRNHLFRSGIEIAISEIKKVSSIVEADAYDKAYANFVSDSDAAHGIGAKEQEHGTN
jgi:hypothetical protein